MDIHSKSMDGLFEKLSQKYGYSKMSIRLIVQSEFELVKNVMKQADSYNDHWPYVRLLYFCVFKVKDGKKKFFNAKAKKVIEDVYSESEQQGGNRAKDAPDSSI